jgi:hypothetical protein
VRRPTERQWWLIWVVVGLVYFFVGVSLRFGPNVTPEGVAQLPAVLGV